MSPRRSRYPLRRSGTTHRAKLLNEGEARLRPECAVDIGDQHATDACFGFRGHDPFGQPGHDRAEIMSGREMPSGRKEHLSIPEPVGGAVDERLIGDTGPVVAGNERFLDEPKDGEKQSSESYL